MFFLLWLSLTASGHTLNPDKSHGVELSSSDHSALFFPFWSGDTRFFRGGLYLVIRGANNEEGMSIYRWDEEGCRRIFQTTPREGLWASRATAVDESGDTLYFSGYLDGLVYRYNPVEGFRRFAEKNFVQSLFVYKGVPVRGHKGPGHDLETVGNRELPVLSLINRRLPEGVDHPSESRINKQEMVLARNGHRLAVGYRLSQPVVIFDLEDGRRLETHRLRRLFAGYIPPTQTFDVKNINRKTSVEWSERHHRLQSLAWFGEDLFGHFQKGYEGYGVWVRLNRPGFVWDNNRQTTKIMAMGPERLLLGSVKETEVGEVRWSLRQGLSLPSAP